MLGFEVDILSLYMAKKRGTQCVILCNARQTVLGWVSTEVGFVFKLFDVAAIERVILGSLYMFFTINYALFQFNG